MSRSYKFPVATDYTTARKYFKRIAAKRVRKALIVAGGSHYKKLYCSYNICDFKVWYYATSSLPFWSWKRK